MQAAVAKLEKDLELVKSGGAADHGNHSEGMAIAALVLGLLGMVLAVWALYSIMQATTKLNCLNPDLALVRAAPPWVVFEDVDADLNRR